MHIRTTRRYFRRLRALLPSSAIDAGEKGACVRACVSASTCVLFDPDHGTPEWTWSLGTPVTDAQIIGAAACDVPNSLVSEISF